MLRPVFIILMATFALGAPVSAAASGSHVAAPVPAHHRISVRTVGNGPDVVLIPGLGSSPAVWEDVVRRFRGRGRLHLVQVAGFAGAPAGLNAQGPVLAEISNELAGYLRSRGIQGARLVGHSTGGKLALMTAARNPKLIGGVMVVDMLPFFGLVLNPKARDAADVRPIGEAVRQQVLGAEESSFAAEQGAAATRYTRSSASRDMVMQGILASDRRVYAQAMGELIATDLRLELGRITAPVTVLYAQADNVVGFPVKDVDGLYRQSYSALPQARLVPVAGSSHMLMHDQPDRLASELRTFIGGKGRSPSRR